MKKTVSVNIKGMNFMIEEDAYELLHHYMQRLEKSLSGQKGAAEIIEDIELRVAELCQGKLSDKKQVVEKTDIEAIISLLGQPEDFVEEEEKAEEFKGYQQEKTTAERRLYRDVEQAKIAGICSGLSNYFNIDVIVVRAIFLLIFFFGGFGFPLYVILWIIIPKANSSIDRLKMQGKAITVDSVREEIENAAERVKNSSKGFATKLKNEKEIGKRFSHIGRFITSVFGIGLIGTGLFFLVVFLVLFFGGLEFIPVQNESGFLSFNQLGEVILSDNGDTFLAWLGILLTSFSVILFFLSNGSYVLLRLKNKWAKVASIVLIISGCIGFSTCVYVGIKVGRDFTSEQAIEKKINSFSTNELLVQEQLKHIPGVKDYRISKDVHPSREEVLIKGERIYNAGLTFHFRPSKDSMYHVFQTFTANGVNYQQAINRAKNIHNSIEHTENTLTLTPEFSFPLKDKLRNQQVSILIEIPYGKWVKIGDERIGFENGSFSESEKWGYLHQNGMFDRWD